MRALVLSGGGSKGAYEVGVVSHLMGTLKRHYDIFCGVSVGAINCAVLAQFPTGEEAKAASELAGLWDTLGDSGVYKSWFGWHLAALWKPSLYNSAPLQEIVRDEIKPWRIATSGKKLRVGAVDLMTGVYHTFTEQYSDVHNAVLASSAFPGMLTPIKFEGTSWTDGGVRSNTPIKTAIELGATAIDIVMCSPKTLPTFTADLKTLDIAIRAIDILTDTVNSYDLDKALLYNRLIKAGAEKIKREVEIHIIRPEFELTKDLLNFDRKVLKAMQEAGVSDAEKTA